MLKEQIFCGATCRIHPECKAVGLTSEGDDGIRWCERGVISFVNYDGADEVLAEFNELTNLDEIIKVDQYCHVCMQNAVALVRDNGSCVGICDGGDSRNEEGPIHLYTREHWKAIEVKKTWD